MRSGPARPDQPAVSGVDPSTQYEAPPLATSRVRLLPVATADYEALRLLELGDGLGPRWRHRGATPTLQAFTESMSAGVLAQFLVVDAAHPSTPVGIVTCYGPDHANGHAYFAAARLGDGASAAFIEGAALFVDYVFACWPFRKLYLETAEFNAPQFLRGLGPMVREEGRLSDHIFANGRHWDQLILAMRREAWSSDVFLRRRDESDLPATPRPSLAEFIDRLRLELDLPDVVLAHDSLVDDLELDSLELFRLAVVIDELAPGWSIPEQLDAEDLTVETVHHYLGLELERRAAQRVARSASDLRLA